MAHRWIAVLVCVLLLASACSSSTNENFVALPTLGPEIGGDAGESEAQTSEPTMQQGGDDQTLSTNGSGDGSGLGIAATVADGPLGADGNDRLVEWYDEFLGTRDRYYVDEASTDELAAYVADRAFLADTEIEQRDYLSLLATESPVATVEFASFSNVLDARVERGSILFSDCMEQQRLSTLGIVGYSWVRQDIVVSQSAGGWVISDVNILHDGAPWSGAYTCAAPSFQERALRLAMAFTEENDRYLRDPSAFDASGAFPMVTNAESRAGLLSSMSEQVDANYRQLSPDVVDYAVIGLQVQASLVDWVVGVEVCIERPAGLVYELDGQRIEDPAIEPGSQGSLEVFVSLGRPGFDGEEPVDHVLGVNAVNDECEFAVSNG